MPKRRIAELIADRIDDIAVAGYPVAARPIVQSRQAYAELHGTTSRLLDLHLRAVKNLATDARGRQIAIGANEAHFPRPFLGEMYEMGHARDMARADVIVGLDGPKFIEYNVGGGFGGMVQFESQRRLWLQVGAEFGGGSLLGFDPFAALAQLIAKTCREAGKKPSAAFLFSSDDPGRTRAQLDAQVQFLTGWGIEAVNLDFRSPTLERDYAQLGSPLAIFQFSEWEALHAGWDMTELIRLLESGVMTGIPSQSSRLLDSKKILALLSEGGLPWMSASDEALARRYIPWTRIIRDRKVDWGTQFRHISEILTNHQEHFVIKGSASAGGKEVRFGRECSGDEWSRLVDAAVESEYFVAQEVVESVRTPIEVLYDEDGSSEVVSAQLVVKPFCIDGVSSGSRARVDVGSESRVVSMETGAAAGCVLGSRG